MRFTGRYEGEGGKIPALLIVSAFLGAWVTVAQLATRKHWVVWCILNLSARCDLNDFQRVVFVCRVFFALHNKHVFEALVVIATVSGRTVAHAVEIKVFERFDNTARVECARTLDRIRIKQRLCICLLYTSDAADE